MYRWSPPFDSTSHMVIPLRPQSNTTHLDLRRGFGGVAHAGEVLWAICIKRVCVDLATMVGEAIGEFKNIYPEAIPALSSDRQITHSKHPTCRFLSSVFIQPRRLLQEHYTVADQRRTNIVFVWDPLDRLQRIVVDKCNIGVKGHRHKIIADI